MKEDDPFFLPFMVLAAASAIYGVVTSMMHPLMFGQSYMEIYPDRMFGKGIQGINVLDFNCYCCCISISIDVLNNDF
jgi:hypothetical protein